MSKSDYSPPPGARVDFMAMGESRDDYGVLPTKGHAAIRRLRDVRDGSASPRELRGVLDRLRSFHFQVHRIRGHEQAIVEHIRGLPAPKKGDRVSSAQAADELSTDFESLLFHGRAVLDRLSLALGREHKQNSDSFSKLRSVLENTTASDPRPRKVIALLDACPGLEGTVMDLGSQKGLRSQVAHRSSLSEGVRNNLSIHVVNGRSIVIDCEAFGRGVLTTARILATDIPFLVVNALRIYFEGAKPLARNAFGYSALFPVVVFGDAIDSDGKGPKLDVYRLDADGFTVETQHVRSEVLKLARRIR